MANDNEERYKDAMDDAKRMRHQLDILTGKVGDLVTAIKGNDLGTEGVVGQIKALRVQIEAIEVRLEAVEQRAAEARAEARMRQRYMKMAYSAAGALVLVIIKFLIDRFVPVIKRP